jgi:hypothetical protein
MEEVGEMAVPRSTRSRAVGVIAVAAMAGTAVVASLAIAHNQAFPNQVKLTKAVGISPALAKYKGRVNSPKARCERNREVQIWNATPTPDVRVGRTRTGPTGVWVDKGARVPNGDKVYALIETKVLLSNAAHDHTCVVDTSPNVVFPKP